MRDSRSVITNSIKGIATEDLAFEMDVSTTRMYEILDRDNPYPKCKQLIKAIGKHSTKGARLIKADLDTLFSNILEESPEMTTAVDLHRESFEALQCILADKPDAMKAKELRELISVAQQLLAGLNAEDELTPREIAESRTRRKFAIV